MYLRRQKKEKKKGRKYCGCANWNGEHLLAWMQCACGSFIQKTICLIRGFPGHLSFILLCWEPGCVSKCFANVLIRTLCFHVEYFQNKISVKLRATSVLSKDSYLCFFCWGSANVYFKRSAEKGVWLHLCF